MPRVNLTTSPSSIERSEGVIGRFNATNWGLAHLGPPTTNTSALSTLFADAAAWANTRQCGVVVVIPPGTYPMNGHVNLPNITKGSLAVEADGASFNFAAGVTNTSMFGTELPSGSSDAEVQNDLRDGWSWRGGDFDGAGGVGNQAFDLNCVSRITMSKIYIKNFDTGIRGRFVLHFHLHDSRVFHCTSYGVRIEEQGDWPGGSASNAASNATLIGPNVRFYGANGQLAQVRICHSTHRVHDCTFEGGNPVINMDVSDGNTSTLSSSFVNCHMENNPTEAHVRVAVIHEYEIDFQYLNTTAKYIKVVSAYHIRVNRLGYPALGAEYAGTPRFESPRDTRWTFFGGGSGVGITPGNPTMWEGGIRPRSMISYAAFPGTNNDNAGPRIGFSDGSYIPGTETYSNLYINADGKLSVSNWDGTSPRVVGTET